MTDYQSCFRAVELNSKMVNGIDSGIIESIPVSPGLEGNSSLMEEIYSSKIRHCLAMHNLKESEITFGQCVDVFTEGSWREGVLIGRASDYSKMLVFFPETNEEIFVLASKVRLTQEWNEVSRHWRYRGMWIFLQIIKKFLRKKFVRSEIKEMWLRLKATHTFREKIKIWHSGSKLIWKELVLDVIRGTKSAVSSSPATHSSSSGQKCNERWAYERVGRSTNVGKFSLASTSHTFKSYATTLNRISAVKIVYIRKQKHLEPHILDSRQKIKSGVESYAEMKEADGHHEDKKFKNNDGDRKIVSSSVSDIKFTLENKEDKKSLASRAWNPVELEGEFCHDLLKLSCSSHAEFKKHPMKKVKLGFLQIQKLKLKKHLVSIGWRIESKRDTMVRFRYISPEQDVHYSLMKVFQYLLKDNQNISNKARNKDNSKDIDSKKYLLEIPPTKADFNSLEDDQIRQPIDGRLSTTQATAKLLCGESDSSELMNWKVMQLNSPEFFERKAQASNNCFETINEALDSKENDIYEDTKALPLSGVIKAYVDYIDLLKCKPKISSVDARELRSKTKDCLLKKGWKFWLYNKKVRQELRYTSPYGRTYLSLYTACKGYLDQLHYENTKEMPFQCINDDKSFNVVSNNLTIISPNKEEAHILPSGLGLITPDNQKSLVMQKVGSKQERISSFNMFDSDEFDSTEHLGKQRRKIEYQKSLVTQKEEMEQGHFSSSNLLDSFGEFDSKEPLVRKREPKKRKIEQSNTYVAVDKRLRNNYCDQKHAVQMNAFRAPCSHKPSSRSSTSLVMRSGKRSRWAMSPSSKDQVGKTILSWLIDKDAVLPRQKVAFVKKTDGHIMKEGWITHDGIKCRCCLNLFPISKFGAHAGCRTSGVSASIILQNGRSLLDCQKQVLSAFKSNKFQYSRLRSGYSKAEAEAEADDICTVCRDGGMIMLCDLCPSAFHPTCIGLEDVPEGKWFCPLCRCGICGLSEFNCDIEYFDHISRIYCDQCERQYHVSCMQKQGLQLKEFPTGTWTCSKACSKIISHLRSLLGNSNPTHLKGLYWKILRSNIEDFGKLDDVSIVENSGLLHIALDVVHECFEAIVEARTQSDLATDIIFNHTSELNRLNFWGFYTMLLMGGDELIGVATFRILGQRLAEMPLIGTRVKFRRQGMCRILMNELQKLLCSLGVERLILPAIPELLKMWTSSFGFTEITYSDRLELLEHTILTFPGTTLCQKFLKKPSVSTA